MDSLKPEPESEPAGRASAGWFRKRSPVEILKIVYNVILLLAIVVDGAILFMALVGMIKFSRKETKDHWIEVTSQIMNGIFTWTAVTTQPWRAYYALAVYQLLKSPNNSTLRSKVRGAFPFLFPKQLETVVEVGELPLNLAMMKRTLHALLLLNLACLFQYPIAAVMWGWASNPPARPSAVIFTFLPLSFICNASGGFLMYIIQSRCEKAEYLATEVADDPTTAI